MTGVIKSEPFILNIGPQHPSTHGVFRIKATVDGEKVLDAEMVMGYLHRSMEKLAEERTYTQNIPFTDRTDYLSSMSNNLGYVLAVEKLAGIHVPARGDAIRVIMAELQRLASHCMAVGAFANDTGAWQTPVMWCFREREKILDVFEVTSGAPLVNTQTTEVGQLIEARPIVELPLNGRIAELRLHQTGEGDTDQQMAQAQHVSPRHIRETGRMKSTKQQAA